jgi:bifunctional oligoribonuclease and PAP phosphatase NrnA
MDMDFDFKLPGLGRPESSRPKRVAEAIKNELSILLLHYLEEPVSHLYAFLPDTELIRTDMDELRSFVSRAGDDVLCVSLDCGDRQRLGRHGTELLRIRPFAVIDHHKGNDGFGDLAWIDPFRSSTGEMIFDLSRALGRNLSPKAATALYAAIVTDTGSFRYESTSAHTFDAARQLVDFGVRPHQVAQHLFDNYTVNRLRLLQKVLASLEVHCGGKVAVIRVTGDMLDSTGCSLEDTENFINLPRSVISVEVAVFLKEVGVGRVSVSMRAKDTCDVADVAACFGGGGHRNAAGFRASETTVEEVRSRLLRELNERLGC